MFAISTKGDYGLVLVSSLAQSARDGTQWVALRSVAQSKKISPKYLEAIALLLKAAGLIESREGRDGGYRLTRSPENISLYEVIQALEGEVSTVRCCSTVPSGRACEENCTLKETWMDAQKALVDFLHGRTVADTLPKPH